MAWKRSVINKVNVAAPAAATTVLALGAPSWAKVATISVEATTAGASTVDAKIVQASPLGTTTARVDTGVAIDQIPASQTAVGRFAAWGVDIGAAVAGTSFDCFAIPVNKNQLISYTTVGTVTNLRIDVEFQGE